jgi:hypothetical protein
VNGIAPLQRIHHLPETFKNSPPAVVVPGSPSCLWNQSVDIFFSILADASAAAADFLHLHFDLYFIFSVSCVTTSDAWYHDTSILPIPSVAGLSRQPTSLGLPWLRMPFRYPIAMSWTDHHDPAVSTLSLE